MPIYEYECLGCNHELEKLQKLSDPPLTDCPQCGAARLRRKISAASFRLKGGGWYETDFKDGNKKNIAGDSPVSTATDTAASPAIAAAAPAAASVPSAAPAAAPPAPASA